MTKIARLKLPSRLKAALKRNHLTATQFAALALITPANASRYLSGETAPTSKAVQQRIANVLGTTLDWFEQ